MAYISTEVFDEQAAIVKDEVENTLVLARMSAWLVKHTRLADKPFSFKDHEYQLSIADEVHPDVCVIKSSQIGMTELTLRILLGFLAVSNGISGIYTMPTATSALRNSKSRITPIIQSSAYLNSIAVPGSDSASFKQLGSSQLFVIGTWGSSIISIPADLVVFDEVDFSSAEVLKTAESRLSHSRFVDEALDIRGIRRRFSTPTLPGVAISAEYEASDRRKFLCKCKHCAEWFWPQFLEHCVVPGWDREIGEITEGELDDLVVRGLAEKARILCPNCHNIITKQNLLPENREWVAETPTVTRKRGYAVSPLDLPAYHSAVSLLLKRLDYRGEEGHYRNFALGVPYADASNGILDSKVQENACLVAVSPDVGSVYGAVMGVDVGKTSHVVVAVPYTDRLDVIWYETVTLRGSEDGDLVDRLASLARSFNVVKLVIDALPYSDSVLALQKRMPEGVVLANSYDLRDKKLAPFLIDERDWTIKSNRTKVLDYIAKRVNSDRVKFARCPLFKTLASHLQGMKRVDSQDEQGNWSGDWQKVGPDHFFHALGYMGIAAQMIAEGYVSGFAMPVGFREAEVGSRYVIENE